MKPILIKLDTTPSYSIREELDSNQTSKYYYHPQVEIVYFEKGNGICIIGDKILNFKSGDVFILGKELPHLFKNDDSYLNKNIKVRTLVLHFLEDFWGKDFLNLPDLLKIKTLLKKAERGLLLKGKTKSAVGALMQKMLNANGSDKILLL
jgi:quercetin dioxygenase-like cupin family protein